MAKAASITRRDALSAAAVFSLPVGAFAAVQLPASPDAAIFELDRQRNKLVVERLKHERALDAAEARFIELRPVVPDDLLPKPIDYAAIPGVSLAGRPRYVPSDRKMIERALASHYDGMFESSVRQRCKAILAALDEYEPRLRAARRKSGIDRARDAQVDNCDQISEIEAQIMATPAVTTEGIVVKARILAEYVTDDPKDDFVRAVIRDLGVKV